MGYILGLIVVALLLLALHYFTELTTTQKLKISAVVLILISAAVFYNTYTQKKQAHMLAVATAFEQGKSVECNGVEVSAKEYTLSIGTYTFIGKKNTQIYGKMISAQDCKTH